MLMFELDTRMKEFLVQVVYLPDWDLSNRLVPSEDQTDWGIKRLIDMELRKMNGELGEITQLAESIKKLAADVVQTSAEGGWASAVTGSALASASQDFTNAVRACYRTRESVVHLVAAARHSGVLPKVEGKWK